MLPREVLILSSLKSYFPVFLSAYIIVLPVTSSGAPGDFGAANMQSRTRGCVTDQDQASHGPGPGESRTRARGPTDQEQASQPACLRPPDTSGAAWFAG